MTDHLRALLYPLGMCATLFFSLRMFLQWISSERKKESTLSKTFWIFTLLGNGGMTVHAFIQGQFPVALLQSFGAAIAWRNLNLMSGRRVSLRDFLPKILMIPGFTLTLFLMEALLFHDFEWMRPPTFPWSDFQAERASFFWHFLGLMGMVLFASRFWIQWWGAEKAKKSYLGKPFWYLSLVGALLSFIYFLRLFDLVNMAGYSVGLIPYLRNIVLQKKKKYTYQKDQIFLFAGEQSGDQLGGELALQLKKEGFSLKGVGGKKMEAYGVEIFMPLERFQVMGFSAVIKAAPHLLVQYFKVKNEILKNPPESVILIDFPDFNLLLARGLRRAGYRGKLIQYVSPTVWAWRRGRIKSLVKHYDLLLSILPFEKEYYASTSLKVAYTGHPLSQARAPARARAPLIALFPGSRHHEIVNNLPVQIEAAKRFPAYSFAISCSHPKWYNLIKKIAKEHDFEAEIVSSEENESLMRRASGAIAKSGTVILELALHQTPTVVTYPVKGLNYFLGKYIFRIRLPHYTLPNIILKRTLFPEFIEKKLNSEEIAKALEELMKKGVQQGCEEVQQKLMQNKTSAAEEVTQLLRKKTIEQDKQDR